MRHSLAVVLMLAASWAHADELYLRNGEVYTGQVEGPVRGRWILHLASGKMEVLDSDVLRVERSALPAPSVTNPEASGTETLPLVRESTLPAGPGQSAPRDGREDVAPRDEAAPRDGRTKPPSSDVVALLALVFTGLDHEPDEARETLAALLADEDAGPVTMEELSALLRSGDAIQRERVARFFGIVVDPRALTSLIEASRDPSATVRSAAVRAIVGYAKDPLALDALCRRLGDDEPAVRLAAAQAIESCGTEECLDCLLEMLADPDDSVRQIAARAVVGVCRRTAPEALDALCEQLTEGLDPEEEAPGLAGRLAALDCATWRPAVGPARALQVHDSRDVRRAALALRLRMGDPTLDADIVQQLRVETDPGVLRLLIGAVGRLKLGTALPAVKDLVDHQDPEVSSAAREALAKLGATSPPETSPREEEEAE